MTDFLPTPFVMTIIAIVVLIAGGSLAYYMHKYQKPDDMTTKTGKRWRRQLICCLVIVALSACTLVASIGIYAVGASKGMTMQNWKDMRIYQIIDANQKAPSTESIPEQSNGHVIILYKYGCTDCETIQDELAKTIANLQIENVHWVATTSDDGKQLIEETHINDVPAIVYLRHEPLANGATTTHMSAYTQTGNDITVNTAALKRIKLLQEKNR